MFRKLSKIKEYYAHYVAECSCGSRFIDHEIRYWKYCCICGKPIADAIIIKDRYSQVKNTTVAEAKKDIPFLDESNKLCDIKRDFSCPKNIDW